MRPFKTDTDAVSSTLAYIIFSAIFLFFFVIILLNANDIIIKGPGNTVVKEQYRDIGNMISSTITDMYLIAPENGNFETEYKIPTTIGGEVYIINAESANSDQIIEVISLDSDKSVSVTLNGIASSMSINGTAYSSVTTHRINYGNEK